MPFYNVIFFVFLFSTSVFLLLVIPFPWNIAVFTVCVLTTVKILHGRIKEKKTKLPETETEASE